MTRHSIKPRNLIFLKSYGFLTFAKNIGKDVSENLSRKYSQKLLNHAKQSAIMHLKLIQKEQFKKQQKQPMM